MIVWVVLWMLAPRALSAQETSAPEPPERPAVQGPLPVEAVQPEIFYLRDEDGKLVPVPSFSLREWQRLYEMSRNRGGQERPGIVLQSLQLTGVVEDQLCRLTATMKIRRRPDEPREDTWQRIPIRFHYCALAEPPLFEGEGEHFLQFDRTDGYVVWLKSPSNTDHLLTLKLLAPVEPEGRGARCLLRAPNVLTSTAAITVPSRGAVGEVTTLADDTTRELEQTPREDKTEFKTSFLRGDVRLSWRPPRAATATTPVRLDVTGNILVRFEDQRDVTSEARLRIRSFGGTLSEMEIALPPEMRLIDLPEPGYEVSVARTEGTARGRRQIVTVRMDNTASREVNVRLLADLPLPEDTSSSSQDADLRPAEFEVLGAARQRGHIDVAVVGEWSLRSDGDPRFVERSDDVTPAEAVPGQIARFYYVRQPTTLALAVRPRASRLTLEPRYRLLVSADRTDLDAAITCTLSGPLAAALPVKLPGWVPDEVLVNDQPVPIDLDPAAETLRIPIRDEIQTGGAFDLRIVAHQSHDDAVRGGEQLLTVQLPKPQVNLANLNVVVIPGRLSVDQAENVILIPGPDDLQNLVQVPGLSGENAPNGTWTWREQVTVDPSVFAASLTIRPLAIQVAMNTSVTATGKQLDVRQALDYSIRFDDVSALTFQVPEELIAAGEPLISIQSGGVSLPLEATDNGTEATARRFKAVLPGPQRGPLQLVIAYAIAVEEGESAVKATVPLVLPDSLGGQLTVMENQASLVHDETIELVPLGDSWRVVEAGALDSNRLSAAAGTRSLPLQIATADVQTTATTILRRTWLQTWLTAGGRRDRVTFVVQTAEPRLEIQLPLGARSSPDQVAVAINQQEVLDKSVTDGGKITVELAADALPGEHVVEVWYSFANERTPGGKLALQAPRLAAADRGSKSYWQLITPRDEHLLWAARDLTAEMDWQWKRVFWGRQALLDQRQLETWANASQQDAIPTSTNQYLFTTFGPLQEAHVLTSLRSIIVLIASGAALFVGLTCIYWPALRNPASVVVFTVLLVAGTIWLPHLAVLVAQAAALGLVLILIAQFLSRSIRRRPATLGTLSSHGDSRISETRRPLSEVGSSGATVTAIPLSDSNA